MSNSSINLTLASAQQRDDKEVVLAAVKRNGYMLECASARLKADRDVVLTAVKECATRMWDPRVILHACQQLSEDPEIRIQAAGNAKRALEEVESLRRNHNWKEDRYKSALNAAVSSTGRFPAAKELYETVYAMTRDV